MNERALKKHIVVLYIYLTLVSLALLAVAYREYIDYIQICDALDQAKDCIQGLLDIVKQKL